MSKREARQKERQSITRLKKLLERINEMSKNWTRESQDDLDPELIGANFVITTLILNQPGMVASVPTSVLGKPFAAMEKLFATWFAVDPETGLIKAGASPWPSSLVETLEGVKVDRIRYCCRPLCGRLFYAHRSDQKACSSPCANYCRVKISRDKAKEREYKRKQREAAKQLRQGAKRKEQREQKLKAKKGN